jgi:hypothetical protein
MGSSDASRLSLVSDRPASPARETAAEIPLSASQSAQSSDAQEPIVEYGAGDGDPRAYERVLAFVDRNRYRLYGALAVFYLLAFSGQWRPEPDSALYLTIGRNLATGEGYTYHGESHRLVFPGLPLTFAGLFKVFGTDTLVPQHLAMLLMGAAALALTYRLFLLHAGRPMAVLVTLLVGVCQTFYRYNFELLTDLPFMLSVMAFLVGYEGVVHRHAHDDPTPTPYPRGKPHWIDWPLLLVGLCAAVVMRPTMIALLIAVAGAAMWPMLRGKVSWGGIAVFVIVALAGVAFYHFDPRGSGGGDYERMLLRPDLLAERWHRAVHYNLPKLFHPTVAEAVFAVDFSPLGNMLISAVLILTSFSLFRAHVLWGLLVVMTVAMLVAVEVHVRYLLFVLPLLVYAWFRVLMWVNQRFSRPVGDRLFAVVLLVFVGTNMVRCGKIIIEQRWLPSPLVVYKSGRFESLPEIARVVRDHTESRAWILVRHKLGRILTFASGRYAVEPDGATNIDPSLQPVYVLEPVDANESKYEGEERMNTETSEWMAAHNIGAGKVLATVKGKFDKQPWVLCRAVKLP